MSIHCLNHNIRRASCASDAADLRLQHNVVKLHSLDPRVLYELLVEVSAVTGAMTAIDQTVARYAGLDPELLRAVGADQFPPCPALRIVRGRHAPR